MGVAGRPAFVLGLFYLKKGAVQKALDKFMQAEKPFNSSYRQALVALWQGRCRDLLGQRSEALEIYRRVLKTAPPESDPPVRAQKGLKRPYRFGAVKHLMIEFLMGDAQEV